MTDATPALTPVSTDAEPPVEPAAPDPKVHQTKERGVRLSRAECDDYGYALARLIGWCEGYRAALDGAVSCPPEIETVDALRALLKDGRGA